MCSFKTPLYTKRWFKNLPLIGFRHFFDFFELLKTKNLYKIIYKSPFIINLHSSILGNYVLLLSLWKLLKKNMNVSKFKLKTDKSSMFIRSRPRVIFRQKWCCKNACNRKLVKINFRTCCLKKKISWRKEKKNNNKILNNFINFGLSEWISGAAWKVNYFTENLWVQR